MKMSPNFYLTNKYRIRVFWLENSRQLSGHQPSFAISGDLVKENISEKSIT